MRKWIFNKLSRKEVGQVLMMVMLLMLVGSVIASSVLPFVGTGLKVGKEVYEERTQLLYAADSGVEDALWQVKNERLSSLFSGYDPYAYYAYSSSYQWQYSPEAIYGDKINSKDVMVTIANDWVPKDITAPSPSAARDIITQAKLVVFGSRSGTSPITYEIKIAYYYEDDDPTGENLRVQKIGVWLPPGFHYDEHLNLTGGCVPSSVEISPYKSGEAVVWSFSALPRFKDFPGGSSGKYPMVITVSFQFTCSAGQSPQAAVSWIDTTGSSAVDYAWDADTKVYTITSVATDGTGKESTVEAAAAKVEMRDLGSTINGDYVAVGNSLMSPTGDANYRNRLYYQNSATITTGSGQSQLPASAHVEAAFLYWSGWIDFHYRYYKTTYPQGWYWGEIAALKYPTTPTPANLTALVETAARVNTVTLEFGSAPSQTVTADNWQVYPSTGADYEGSWIYACYYDATDLVKELIDDGLLGANGSGTYMLKHADAVVGLQRPGYEYYSFSLYNTGQTTGYPLGTPAHTKTGSGTSYETRYNYAHAGWSLVIIYSSPETAGHQLYLYDIRNPSFTFTEGWAPGGVPDPDFDGDGNPGGLISGFLAPEEIQSGGVYAAKLTCFVGEGDAGITGDCLKVNSVKHWDNITISGGSCNTSNTSSCPNNVWNSQSVGLTASGVDIDTFTVNYPVIKPGDTSAQVDPTTGSDGFTLIYIILSFRSTITTGGTISYLVR